MKEKLFAQKIHVAQNFYFTPYLVSKKCI